VSAPDRLAEIRVAADADFELNPGSAATPEIARRISRVLPPPPPRDGAKAA
jgi:hypothetical protein